jgi:hypothetical protein
MLTTAMTAQMSTISTTWAVLTELVLAIRDARNGPKAMDALGTTPLVDKACNVTAVAPMPSPTEPRPMATLAHTAWPGLNAALSQPGVYLLVDFRADPLDQSLGHGDVVLTAEFCVDGRRCGDILVCPLIHGANIYSDR